MLYERLSSTDNYIDPAWSCRSNTSWYLVVREDIDLQLKEQIFSQKNDCCLRWLVCHHVTAADWENKILFLLTVGMTFTVGYWTFEPESPAQSCSCLYWNVKRSVVHPPPPLRELLLFSRLRFPASIFQPFPFLSPSATSEIIEKNRI